MSNIPPNPALPGCGRDGVSDGEIIRTYIAAAARSVTCGVSGLLDPIAGLGRAVVLVVLAKQLFGVVERIDAG